MISQSHIPRTIRYVQNQRQHHSKATFEAEYRQFLHIHEINADERKIFGYPCREATQDDGRGPQPTGTCRSPVDTRKSISQRDESSNVTSWHTERVD